MSKLLATPGALGLGAACMYLLDPGAGNRRRARLRDIGVRATSEARDFIDVALRDLRNRGYGALAETRYRFRGGNVGDDVLVRRVAAKMGRCVSHPRAIGITAENGRVTLTGRILAHEVDSLCRQIEAIPGVKSVVNRLEAHRQPGNIPDLQGGRNRTIRRAELMQGSWSPGTRLLLLAGGGFIILDALRKGGVTGLAQGLAGALLTGRAATNMDLPRLFGVGGGRRGVTFQKTLTINAPCDDVFEFFSGFVNFPHFMRHVRAVRDLGNGRSHWEVTGPAGVVVSWNAVTTRLEPSRLIAWKSERDAALQHAGMITFEDVADGMTRVSVRMSYNPPAGLIGHAVAAFLGADPKHEMDDDFMRAKAFLETGRPARDAAAHDAGRQPVQVPLH